MHQPSSPLLSRLVLPQVEAISFENTLGDPELGVLLCPGQTCRSWALVLLLLSTLNLVRPTQSNSNHVLNRILVNQKPG